MIELKDGISLLSGAMFDYNNPEKSDVTIEDIAVALSNVCRFSGHVQYFYSVAQHAVNVSYIVPEEHALTGLMHDTAEAFTNDLPTPLKVAFPAFKDLENKIEKAMSNRFKFEYPLPPVIKTADLQMLKLEKETVKGDKSEWDCLKDVTITTDLRNKVTLSMWTPAQSMIAFLNRWDELTDNKRILF